MSAAPLRVALQFLTRLPVSAPAPDAALAGRAMLCWPLAGALIGALLALLGVALGYLGMAALPLAVVLVIAWVAVTGGLHLDGLADSADGWIGGQGDRDRTLEIMRDPRSGPMGVTALVLVLLAKVAALAVLWRLGNAIPALIAAALLGRASCLALYLSLPYARTEGIGRSAADNLSPPAAWTALGLAWLAAALLAPLAALAAAMWVLWVRRALQRRLGGFTGDTAGALVETVEVVVLLTAGLAF
ncbi:adenosylcobinamide-GDP ribazoletransferase [Isoalcanivorax beigongshangi]|uniref:Adenosylcobinamide-GDP ribazoletransferase n=1 Tax=Isoalcanivorax beigongshangi TaxID=3238810 RepID=A0ABV4AF46_9GAMM